MDRVSRTIANTVSPVGQSSNQIPPDVLADRARAYRQTTASNQPVLPRTSDLFRRPFVSRIRSQIRGRPSILVERPEDIPIVQYVGRDVIDVPVPLLERERVEACDDRLALATRARAPTRLTVGAVEVVFDGMTRGNSEIAAGAVLYDSRDTNLEQAFQGAVAATVTNQVSRSLFYPTIVAHVNDPIINSFLRLAVVSPNNTFRPESIAFEVRVSGVAELTHSPNDTAPTTFLLRSRADERAHAIRYYREGIRHNTAVVAAPIIERPTLPNFSIPLGRSFSMVQRGNSLQWDEVLNEEENVVLNFDSSRCSTACEQEVASASNFPRRKKGKGKKKTDYEVSEPAPCTANKFKRHDATSESDSDEDVGVPRNVRTATAQGPIVDVKTDSGVFNQQMIVAQAQALPPFQMVVASGTFKVPLTVVSGEEVWSYNLANFMETEGTYNKLLRTFGTIPGSMCIRIVGGVGPYAGIVLTITLIDGGSLSAATEKSVAAMHAGEHFDWNPSFEEDISFSFNPFSCADYWQPNMLRSMSSKLRVIASTTWIQSPSEEKSFTYCVYVKPDTHLTKSIFKVGSPPMSMQCNKFLGEFAYPKGVTTTSKRVALNPVTPALEGSVLFLSLTQNLLAFHRYVKADIEVELVRGSCAFLEATVGVAVLSGGIAWDSVLREEITHFPSLIVSFRENQPRVTFKIPWGLIGGFGPSDRNKFKAGKANVEGASLGFWIYDSVSGKAEGKFSFIAKIVRLQNLTVLGQSAGYHLRTARAQTEFGRDIYYDILTWKKDSRENHPDVSLRVNLEKPTKSSLARVDGKLEDIDIKEIDFINSPLLLLFTRAAWLKGRFRWRLTWHGDYSVKAAEISGGINVSVHESTLDTCALFRKSSHFKDGTIEFEHEIDGPTEGFKYNARWFPGVKGNSMMSIMIKAAEDFGGYELACQILDMEVSGSHTGRVYDGNAKDLTSIVDI